MTLATLHYIYDPLCGWCYAAGPMVAVAVAAGIPLALHGGGLWPTPTGIAPDKRSYIRAADSRIATLTGVAFGSAYLDGSLLDPDLKLWSRPTTAAVLAADALEPGDGLAMLHAIQRAHYIEGRRVVEPSVLAELAGEIGIAADEFTQAVGSVAVDDHIAASRSLMDRFGLRGFPGFVLEREGTFSRVDHEPFYGHPAEFATMLASLAAISIEPTPFVTQRENAYDLRHRPIRHHRQ